MNQEAYEANLKKIVEACEELGWMIGVSDINQAQRYIRGVGDSEPSGLIIGHREWIEEFYPEIVIDPEIQDIVRDRNVVKDN